MNKLGATLELAEVHKRAPEEKRVKFKKICVEERESQMDSGLGDQGSKYQPVVQQSTR